MALQYVAVAGAWAEIMDKGGAGAGAEKKISLAPQHSKIRDWAPLKS